jgi:hypothetical protein
MGFFRLLASCSTRFLSATPTVGLLLLVFAPTTRAQDEFRSFDGSGNNLSNPDWGRAGTPLLRQMIAADYEDGVSVPRSIGLPGARDISNACASLAQPRISTVVVSDFFWQWGQFVDHDIDLTPVTDPAEAFDIPVPAGDPYFDPEATGTVSLPLTRSAFSDGDGARQQINTISAFIDASNVYGSDLPRANGLRSLDGTGRLDTSAGDLLPFNVNGMDNAPTALDPELFLAGDVRANEQAALTALHTLFVREHNWQADRIRQESPELDGEEIYQRARAIVGAEMQAITYREFVPLLPGPGALPDYEGYDPLLDPGIENAFSTAAYRFGHSMLSAQLLQLAPNGEPLPQGPFPLRDVFFSPKAIRDRGIEPFLRGLAAQPAQSIDPFLVDDVRNFLFGDPGSGGLDLASLNIQRGRDHGMARYNACREALGLPPRTNLVDISSDPEIQVRLALAYDDVEDVDVWVGGLAEDRQDDALVGETFFGILRDQFQRLRDGDRFWYEAYLSPDLVAYVEAQTLATIIRRNTTIGSIQDDVFLATDGVVAVADVPPARSEILGLPFPNPTTGGASIHLNVPADAAGAVELAVFDARGRRVRTLENGTLGPGRHTIRWDRTDSRGKRAGAGFYFLRVSGPFGVTGRKLLLLD